MFACIPKITCRGLRVFSTVSDVELCSRGWSEIVRTRTSCRKYKNQDVDNTLLDTILSETILAPTARNWQPYKIVIMKDKKNLEKLTTFMPAKNADVIKQVPAVAVFLADQDPIAMGEEFKGLWKRQGKDEGMVANILKGFSKVIGKGGMTRLLAKCSLKQTSNKSFSMEYYTNREWSIKQSVFPMEMFVLSCQAHGLSTIVMEGFDGRHVRKLINCPDRYFVTGLVPFGYSAEEGVKPTLRYEADKLIYNETFGESRTTVPEFRRE